jgi:drug/metabolite transporter (DMT)-like permease
LAVVVMAAAMVTLCISWGACLKWEKRFLWWVGGLALSLASGFLCGFLFVMFCWNGIFQVSGGPLWPVVATTLVVAVGAGWLFCMGMRKRESSR